MPVRPYVCPYALISATITEFSWNFLRGAFIKICRHILILVKIASKWWSLYTKTYVHLSLVFIMESLFSVRYEMKSKRLTLWHWDKPFTLWGTSCGRRNSWSKCDTGKQQGERWRSATPCGHHLTCWVTCFVQKSVLFVCVGNVVEHRRATSSTTDMVPGGRICSKK